MLVFVLSDAEGRLVRRRRPSDVRHISGSLPRKATWSLTLISASTFAQCSLFGVLYISQDLLMHLRYCISLSPIFFRVGKVYMVFGFLCTVELSPSFGPMRGTGSFLHSILSKASQFKRIPGEHQFLYITLIIFILRVEKVYTVFGFPLYCRAFPIFPAYTGNWEFPA